MPVPHPFRTAHGVDFSGASWPTATPGAPAIRPAVRGPSPLLARHRRHAAWISAGGEDVCLDGTLLQCVAKLVAMLPASFWNTFAARWTQSVRRR